MSTKKFKFVGEGHSEPVNCLGGGCKVKNGDVVELPLNLAKKAEKMDEYEEVDAKIKVTVKQEFQKPADPDPVDGGDNDTGSTDEVFEK